MSSTIRVACVLAREGVTSGAGQSCLMNSLSVYPESHLPVTVQDRHFESIQIAVTFAARVPCGPCGYVATGHRLVTEVRQGGRPLVVAGHPVAVRLRGAGRAAPSHAGPKRRCGLFSAPPGLHFLVGVSQVRFAARYRSYITMGCPHKS